ncbi:MAG: DNA repair protein RadC [Flavobacteriales bacterium]|nr:DNA repair protein RadC [Flavobacteriales bacterium]
MNTISKKLSIKDWAEEDRPREKLLSKGKKHLTEAELLAIVIGSGIRNESALNLSQKVLNHVNNDLNQLTQLSVSDLITFKGIGEARAVSIVAAMELSDRRPKVDTDKKKKIQSSRDAFNHLQGVMTGLQHEEFWLLLLNRGNKVVAKHIVSRGGISGTVIDNKIIFKLALQHTASSIILCHNHPSGNVQPSQADVNLTKKIKAGGEMMDIKVLDHIIISERKYYSFADEGII